MARLLPGLALVLAGGCELAAEVRRVPPAPPPPGLVLIETPDPLRAALDEAAAAFADRGQDLAGQPARAAQALAQLEYVAATLPADQRYAAVAANYGRDLALARDEGRDALGVMVAAPAPAVTRALLAAAAALRAGNAAGAAAALPAPMFRPGGAESVARLGELGPLPQVAVTMTTTQQAVAQIDGAVGLLGVTGTQQLQGGAGLGPGPIGTGFAGASGAVRY